jgi:hypothetical protein
VTAPAKIPAADGPRGSFCETTIFAAANPVNVTLDTERDQQKWNPVLRPIALKKF